MKLTRAEQVELRLSKAVLGILEQEHHRGTRIKTLREATEILARELQRDLLAAESVWIGEPRQDGSVWDG